MESQSKIKASYWFSWAMINFFLAASMGTILRFAFVDEINWLDYRNFMHAHSHVAILGWAFLGFFSLLVSRLELSKERIKIYQWLFWGIQISIIGMLISFACFGYQPISISFSTLHMFLGYGFVYCYWKDLNKLNLKRQSSKFIKTGLFFLLVSTLALWLMPIVILLELQNKPIYYIAVQFYLHFQFNGWFIFTALGIFLYFLEHRKVSIPDNLITRFYNLLFISCFLTFALAITWTNPMDVLFYVNSLGVLIQLASLYYFIRMMRYVAPQINKLFSSQTRLLLYVSFFSFAAKIIIQTAVVIPYIGTIAYTIRNFVLGYLHLLLLGMITFFLLAFGQIRGLAVLGSPIKKMGLNIFILGFVLTESLLFLQGTLFWASKGFIPYYYELIFGATVCLPLGVLMMIDYSKHKKSSTISST